MSRTIPAIFDAGVFRPLQPVELAEGTRVEVALPVESDVEANGALAPAVLVLQQKTVAEMLAEIESLPIEEPDDGFSGRDHDKVLYGRP